MKIGLTTRLDICGKTSEIRASIDANWIDFLKPIATSIHIFQTYDGDLNSSLDNFDLVILTGGNNLSSLERSDLSQRRDKCELDLLSKCIAQKVPVVGVCRGMQLIHAYFGGKLAKLSNHVRTNHQLNTNASWLDEISLVNSYHNWGLVRESLSSDLAIEATSAGDGSVEAISHKNIQIRGIMWHPERWNDLMGDRQKFREKQYQIMDFN